MLKECYKIKVNSKNCCFLNWQWKKRGTFLPSGRTTKEKEADTWLTNEKVCFIWCTFHLSSEWSNLEGKNIHQDKIFWFIASTVSLTHKLCFNTMAVFHQAAMLWWCYVCFWINIYLCWKWLYVAGREMQNLVIKTWRHNVIALLPLNQTPVYADDDVNQTFMPLFWASLQRPVGRSNWSRPSSYNMWFTALTEQKQRLDLNVGPGCTDSPAGTVNVIYTPATNFKRALHPKIPSGCYIQSVRKKQRNFHAAVKIVDWKLWN